MGKKNSIFKKDIEKVSPLDISKTRELTEIWMKKAAVVFLFCLYAGAMVCTFLIYFLQGFQWHGFKLEYSLLRWLGGATIGEVAGLAALVYGSLFKKQ